ncbi:MAG: chorismate mutase [Candidatus Bipolaricaulota bacterium]|nr:chorismate mutase [Candidatus Bipolaricaulota bacterium]
MNLDRWRQQIDQIDERLLELLNERAELALQIGREKRARGLAVHSPEREAQILQRVCALNRGPLDEHAIRGVFSKIFEEFRRLQESEA